MDRASDGSQSTASASKQSNQSLKENHDYHDYAAVTEDTLSLLATSVPHDGARFRRDEANAFPPRLHYLLTDVEADGLSHIIGFQPHGRAFLVRDMNAFVCQLLPLWFRHNSYSSFQRQLNIYGFKRLTIGPDKGAYYHELFLRSKRFLSYYIRRVKVKGTGVRRCAAPESEPDFYNIPYLPPSDSTQSAGGLKRSKQAPDPTRITGLGPNRRTQFSNPFAPVQAEVSGYIRDLIASPLMMCLPPTRSLAIGLPPIDQLPLPAVPLAGLDQSVINSEHAPAAPDILTISFPVAQGIPTQATGGLYTTPPHTLQEQHQYQSDQIVHQNHPTQQDVLPTHRVPESALPTPLATNVHPLQALALFDSSAHTTDSYQVHSQPQSSRTGTPPHPLPPIEFSESLVDSYMTAVNELLYRYEGNRPLEDPI